MINMINVSKVYPNGTKALTDITLRIEKGEFVFLVGPSGAGKSTMTKLIFREEQPSRGQILFNRKNISRYKQREIPYIRRSIGVIFQDFRLLQSKTVAENVAFALEVIEASRKEIRKAVPEALALVRLADKANVMPSELSGGEQQRVAIARAIVNNPPLVIADEPTGNLDPDTSWEIVTLLQEINKCGTTIIMATHAKEIVDSMRKRVVALEKGKIARDEERGGYGYED
ncbi:cell division ATP-binding protein FtsE [Phosphitispora fastidiosa]|uniref:cell division ATP-binding protein FtsE n=1 Tax=Phosphitispora fastidiosa TaxID=2837202 RepID=UPI001E5EB233|nr:cell division ATP-binding protein FtsE [Phosphitispora fastidiosa]MBU7006359.1 cell division transport system ATP-binding protein [Phosphitispora fastidiosa]